MSRGGGCNGLLLLLVFTGWRKKWWATLQDSPLLKLVEDLDMADEAAAPEPVLDLVEAPAEHGGGESIDSCDDAEEPGDDAGGERVSKNAAARQVRAEKSAAGHIIKYACSVVSRQLSQRLFKVLLYLPAAFESSFNDELVSLKTRWGTRDLFRDLQQGYFQ